MNNLEENRRVKAWRKMFKYDPVSALDCALLGVMHLGPFEGGHISSALRQLIIPEDNDKADLALTEWFKQELITRNDREVVDMARYYEALSEAFILIISINLVKTEKWCIENKEQITKWLDDVISPYDIRPKTHFLNVINKSK